MRSPPQCPASTRPIDGLAALSHQAAVTAAKTKVIVDEFALRSATALFDVGGASAPTLRQNLGRY
ncbi:hypothetical protein AB4Z10_08630 [Bosea sp. RAF48]|uniref:hypothetical protein n=1 Tax=Bosea sp. RAF48 TaxID=3237480 RepID=UPI003F935918